MTNARCLDAEDIREVIAEIEDFVRSERTSDPAVVAEGPAYFRARDRGVTRSLVWREGSSWRTALAGAMEALANQNCPQWTTLEVSLTHSYRRVDLASLPEARNVYRGVLGVEIRTEGSLSRYSPTEMIAFNLDLYRAVARAAQASSPGSARLVSVSVFEAYEFLVTTGHPPRVQQLHRGDRIVALEEVDEPTIGRAIDDMADWLVTNVSAEGQLPYKYWPSRGKYSPANNTVRQFMATACLGQLARFTGRADICLAAERNLTFNLEQFYRDRNGLGSIEYDGSSKLGAIAVAAIAIRESPVRGDFRNIEEKLLTAIAHLWTPSGRFRTFLMPSQRDDNHNFYPGEALLCWAEAYAEGKDPTLLARILRSIEYYGDWHRSNPNPAFVPWHTRAYARLWDATRDASLPELIFSMNDWLIPLQEWERQSRPELRGRFFDHRHPEYGPPHASSTGVYLEGLAEAYRIATSLRDLRRAATYRLAILRGARNLLQLQFRDDSSQFYIAHRSRTAGALRTEVYDNTLRIDNIQHCCMAFLVIMRDLFTA